MQIWGVSVVRDIEDIVEISVRHLLNQGVDHIIVADVMSIDSTPRILERLAAELPITVLEDRDPAHRQSEKMTALANRAAENGAEWIVPFDGDELWRAYGGQTIREAILDTSADILEAACFDHYPRPTLRRGTVVDRMPWSKTNPLPKVAFRWQPGAIIAMGQHDVLEVHGTRATGVLLIDHYPARSCAQYRRKVIEGAKAAELAGLPLNQASHWRELSAMSPWRFRLKWWKLRLAPRLRLQDRALRPIPREMRDVG